MSIPSNYECEGQMSIDDWLSPDSWCGKTSPEHSVQTEERISELSYKKQRKSLTKMPLFLDLRGNGHHQDASWETDGASLGEYTMHSFGESPSVVRESRLSQILEANPHPKYCLSATACQGILNRAERRGKTLPPILKEALIQQVIRSKLGGGSERDSSGKKAGKGPLVQTELSATLGVSQDQTLICLEGNGSRDSHKGNGYIESDVMYTINTVEQHAVAYGLDRASFNQGQNAKFDFSVDEEIAPPIVAKGPGG